MSSSFSSGGLRRTAIALVLLGALTCLAAPAVAHPAGDSTPGGQLAGLFDWLHELLRDLGWGPGEGGEEPEGPKPAFLPDGACIDPGGNPVPCPESETVGLPPEMPMSQDADR